MVYNNNDITCIDTAVRVGYRKYMLTYLYMYRYVTGAGLSFIPDPPQISPHPRPTRRIQAKRIQHRRCGSIYIV